MASHDGRRDLSVWHSLIKYMTVGLLLELIKQANRIEMNIFKSIIYAITSIFKEPKPMRGRFKDGRMYEISPDGGLSIVLEDELTQKIYKEDIIKFNKWMRENQPHMYDENGNFIGGELKRHTK